jgi:predicted CoA-binding protein
MLPAALRAMIDDPAATRVAVVGATDTPGKYGGIITRDLLRKGFQVLPVHPTADTVAGAAARPEVGDHGRVDIVNFVVPASVGRRVLAGLDPAAVGALWFQPGSYDAALVAEARRRFPLVVAGPCIMVEAR